MYHCQDNNTEDLLRLLLRSDGSKFKEDIVKNWYRARKFVLGTLVANDVFDNIIRQQQKIHVVLEGTSDLMMSVARQIAFVAHEESLQNLLLIEYQRVKYFEECNC